MLTGKSNYQLACDLSEIDYIVRPVTLEKGDKGEANEGRFLLGGESGEQSKGR